MENWKGLPNEKMKKMTLVLSMLLLSIMLMAGCSKKEESLVGKWVSETSNQVIEFTQDGHYNGLAQLNYTYEILDGKQIKIINPEYADGSDSLVLDFVIKDGILTTTNANGDKVNWKRQ